MRNPLIYISLLITASVSGCDDESEPKPVSPTLEFQSDFQQVNEGDGMIFIPFTVNPGKGDGSLTLEIEYELSGTATSHDQIMIDHWDDKGIYANIIDDSNEEQRKTLTITLTNAGDPEVGVINSHTLLLIDDDTSIIGFATPTGTVSESENFKIKVNLTPLIEDDEPVSFQFRVSTGTAKYGEDFTVDSKIENGEFILIVSAIDDAIEEAPETVILILLNIQSGKALLTDQESEKTITIRITD